MPIERVQKILAAAGFGSRRACEQLVVEGRVAVNGQVARELPVLVNPESDRITVDGKPVRPEKKVYFMLHKPKDVFCTAADPDGRRRAIDLLRGVPERVFPVGRLDADSTGLLLLTNDGELTQRLTHPRYGLQQTYRAEVAGRMDESTLHRMREGVWLAEGKSSPAEATIIYRRAQSTIIEIVLREARNREVRRVLAKLGHKVYRLTRIKYGNLSLKSLPIGAFRPLRPEELKSLLRAASGVTPMSAPPAARVPRPRPASAARPARGLWQARGASDSRPGRRKSSRASWGR